MKFCRWTLFKASFIYEELKDIFEENKQGFDGKVILTSWRLLRRGSRIKMPAVKAECTPDGYKEAGRVNALSRSPGHAQSETQ